MFTFIQTVLPIFELLYKLLGHIVNERSIVVSAWNQEADYVCLASESELEILALPLTTVWPWAN